MTVRDLGHAALASGQRPTRGARLHRVKYLACSLLLLMPAGGVEAMAKITSLPPPPSEKINYHIVSAGETLFAIAWRYELTVQSLAAINGISPPYTIRVGQQLLLKPHITPASPAIRGPQRPTPPPATREPSPLHATAPPKPDAATGSAPPSVAPTALAAAQRWRWPTAGTVARHFDNQRLFKGIDIQGRAGQPVVAAAAGTVVYAGSGLAGYGQLIIVKHDETYLSAYAHNRNILIAEGAQVKGGDRIGEIGGDPGNPTRLYFEIRRDGKPIDPLSVLPR